MNIYNYIDLIKKYPKPTSHQINNFIEQVSLDHSWYKHLTKERIHEFVIYLDPNAGRSLMGYREEKVVDIEDNNKIKKKYYCKFKDIETDVKALDYQERYGFLTYYTYEGYTRVLNLEEDGSVRDSKPYVGLNIATDSGLTEPLPIEIVEYCTIKLSRYVSDCFSRERCDRNWDESAEICIEKHEELIKDLKRLIKNLIYNIYR